MIENKYASALDGLEIEDPVKSFFDFCKERENIRISRENGEDFPWSKDEIFQNGRFLNVFREDDRVSKSIIKFAGNLNEEPSKLIYAVFFARWCNRQEVLDTLTPDDLNNPENLKNKLERNLNSILKVVRFSLVENKQLRKLILLSSSIGMATLSAAWFAQPYFTSIDLPLKYFGFVWAMLNLTAGFSSVNSYKLNPLINQKTKLLIIASIIGICFIGLSSINNYYGLIFLIVIYVMRGFATPTLYNLINKETSSEIRATVLSVRSFCIRLSFAITAPVIGWVSDNGSLGNGLFILGITTTVLSLISLWKLDLSDD